MNFLAAIFLLFMSEEEAFWLLSVFVEELLPNYYTTTMIGSQVDAQTFSDILMSRNPRLHSHLQILGIPIELRVTSWFLSCYCTILPTEVRNLSLPS